MTEPIAGLTRDGLIDALSRAQFHRRLLMGFATALATLTLLFVGSSWRTNSPATYHIIQFTGLTVILLAIAGRTWCAVHIGGRKKVSLVQTGPYALVRHPLYSFSIMGAAGIGALWGSVIVSFASATVTAMILKSVARQEEHFLADKFGTEYATYAAQVGRYLPRRLCGPIGDAPKINREVALRTLIQSSLFLTGVPVAALAQWGQSYSFFPILVSLP